MGAQVVHSMSVSNDHFRGGGVRVKVTSSTRSVLVPSSGFGIGRGAPNTDPSSVWYTERVFSPMYYERKRKREEMENGEDYDDA